MSLHQLRAERATLFDSFKALAEKSDFDVKADQPVYDKLKADLEAKAAEIERYQAVQDASRQKAQPVALEGADPRVYAAVKSDIYTSKAAAEERGLLTNKGLVVGGVCRMLSQGRGSARESAEIAAKLYGENHPVTKALVAGIGGSGGFIVPPEYINEIIELLRATAVVRTANPRTMPMPRGSMTLPSQTAAATASYNGETSKITASQQTLGQIVASYKKLTALVPVANDLMRYADPAADAFVRDDLTKVMALREDLAFLTGDGTQGSPKGFLAFASQYTLQQGGAAGGTFLSTADSTYATTTVGNFITSTEVFTLATVATELGGLVNRLDTANVPDFRRCWFMHPRSYNYLFSVQNSLGLYVYRDELMHGTLLNYPVKRSTQIPINIYDTTGASTTCSFVFLVEMTDAMILDSMTLELFVSREGSYVDSGGNQVNCVQTDETLIRAIAEHDFQMRHPASVAVDQGVLWAPQIT